MDQIHFTINGDRYSLTGFEVSSSTSLNDYLRNYLHLHGTKAMCHEGGCGACVVAVSLTHPTTKEKQTLAVNSCLVHILSCHDWDITTIEGIGNRNDGYHAIQKRLAAFNGTQCGYCSPGLVMSMHSLSKGTSTLTMQQVENSFGSSICRCTGYRPILDAFKSFANDLDPALKSKLQDVEELDKLKCIKSCSKPCSVDDGWCFIGNDERMMKNVTAQGTSWYKAYTVQDIFKVLAREGSDSYSLVSGNTGQGVFPTTTQPKVLIDISSIEALRDSSIDVNLIIGAGTTLTDLMKTFKSWSIKNDFSYLTQFYKHLDLVAHIPVRNIGTIGGNLAMKNMHNFFPSDIFLLLETVGANVTLMDSNLRKSQLKMEDFLKVNLKGSIILDVKLPPLSKSNLIRTYKIMPRAQNAHAIVNAGFLYKMDATNKVESANLVFGNIGPSFTNAKDTGNLLKGQDMFNDETLRKALKSLNDELVPIDVPPEPSAECRKAIALGLFYKSVLSLAPTVNPRYASGGFVLERDVSRGIQTFDTDKSLWPLNKPMPKMEALSQCSGEAKYACDISSEPRAVHVAFVLSQICKGEIESFDASEALKTRGVVAFFTAKDIPGKNSFTSPNAVPWQEGNEEILATKILYYGQPIALVAAVTHKLAISAAALVKVKYKKSEDKPVLSVRDALKAPDKERRVRQEYSIEPTDKGTDITHVLKGSFMVPSQYHFHMETQCCTVSNTSRGIRIRAATQWMDAINVAVGNALGISHNRVEVIVPRLGGSYGAKGSRSSMIACACALVAYKLNRTATLVMPLVDNMTAIGGRQQCDFDYEIGVNSEGQIQYLDLTSYSDQGCAFSDTAGDLSYALNTYDISRWKMKGYSVLTDKASNTWCRAPGTTEATAVVEHIMERISQTVKKDAGDIRLMHLSKKMDVMKEIINTFKSDCDFVQRRIEIEKFNKDNAWKKKALKLSIMAYPIAYSWNYPVTISVYHADGTIAMSHGGIEMGQGINTKVAQVCAYTLKVPFEKVTVKASDNFTSPNAMASNGSITSDCIAFATVKACQELLARLAPVRRELTEPTWEEVITAAFNKGINLQTSYMASPLDSLEGYSVYGVCAAEVELDVLTGNHILRRVDLLEDTGVSMSPDIDVGQIEGAFMMGLGLWTSEHLIFDPSGKLLTNRTWYYKPPGAKDIPVDFRISFRRNAPNATGVLRSKATGEPALVLAVAVAFALHDAILEARKEFGYEDNDWVFVDSPYNVENIMKAIAPKYEYYKLR